ncbi:hypothetical protein [Deinococcus peraridilitoris]|uniref:Uncharacterized protein n=1 Tax=Deinococcus peraridilitoris (strain DSM 19664 / LMG 22246 / CIP 109416 / KR-200) TaxID=937777 RepID=L0A0V0_DEIPD|nr:hypothetical protein [Deinococcus peraridilitoris]AFZ67084.1 hypothetical protein Deipe_1543 [Deinococcus peraridilitoris DSM 19664]
MPTTDNNDLPKRRGRGPRPKYDWTEWRRKYYTGNQTLEELSVEKGAPGIDSLKRRSSEENWSKLREEFRHQVDTELRAIQKDVAVQVRDRVAKIGQAFQTVAVRGLSHLDPQKLEAVDIARFGKYGVEIELKARGLEESTVVLRASESLKKPSDLKNLSADELLVLLKKVREQT